MLNETARPHFVAQDGHYLFAWHHPARPAVRRGASVVLCPTYGGEFPPAYRVWRKLAEQLAGIGFDVFRFDYEGTGDSAGDVTEPDRVEAWLRNIDRMVKEARELTGSSEVALVGLRIGATLALHAAAARGGVDRLVLWSPFRSGRTFVRELKALSRLINEPYVTKTDGPDILAAGYVLPGPVASALEQLDVDALPASPAPHVLLVERDDLSPDPKVGEILERLGSCVTRVRPAGTGSMLEPGVVSNVPADALNAITHWLDEWPCAGSRGVRFEATVESTSALVYGSGYHERAVRFGPEDRLFGILSAPNGAGSSAPAIIFLNTGFDHRVGPGRFYVPLAREWAARGHVVLRYDLGGIGDSEPPSGAGENVWYPAHALDDLREAITFITTQAPGRRLIVAGLCSGGWHAFRAACEGLAVDAIVSINPPLYLRDGIPTPAGWNEYKQVETYRTALREPARWARALRGRSAYRSFLRFAACQAVRKLRGRIGAAFGGRFVDGLARDLTGMSAGGVTILFVFSRGERGLQYFQLHGSAPRRRNARERIRLVVVDDAGHTFSPPAAQQALRGILVDFVEHQTREVGQAGIAAEPFHPAADHGGAGHVYRRNRRPA
jgi:alpha-beta hydrolase superfamily lysophospholipase